jgi:transketolase
MTHGYTDTDQLAVNTIRTLSIDGVQAANSGHPGLPLGAAPMAYVLWSRFMRFNPSDPHWPARDRFILSAGHGSMLLYSLLHLAGYDLSLDDLKQFRQWGSKTPGHPESHMTAGVEVSTGPLGQGFGNGVGMAMAGAFLAANYNRPGHTLFDHYIYAIVSDGDLMEGVAAEAASLAGHLKLGKLIYLYDDNLISLDGPTNLAFTEDVLTRFNGYGWHTQRVTDGNDLAAIEAAVHTARAETEKPSLIAVRTIIGFGSPKAGTSKVHGTALGVDGVRATKLALGFDPDQSFVVPGAALEAMRTPGEQGAKLQQEWQKRLAAYSAAFPKEAAELKQAFAGELPSGWDSGLASYTGGEVATRDASGKAMEELSQRIPWMIGGSADLSESTKTPASVSSTFQPGSYQERVVWFGVREHGMGAALNGMASHGGVVPFGGTFLTFSDYMRGSIRIAALAHHPVVYVFTHDSIGLGEDGPTHQPVEQVMSLRLIPNMHVIRPADANETVEAWKMAITRRDGPTALILSRQKLPVFDRSSMGSSANTQRGAYVLSEADSSPQVTIIGTGSEVELAVGAQAALHAQGIAARVVSMPCWEVFAAQDAAYRESVLIPGGARISIEAGVTTGWQRWIGDRGVAIGVDTFGASAPYKKLYEEYGLTVAHIVAEAQRLVAIS